MTWSPALVLAMTASSAAAILVILIAFKFFGSAIIEGMVSHALDKRLEDYRRSLDRRQKAEKIAEFLSYASRASDDRDQEFFRKTNQLAWELLLFLPSEIYREVVKSVQGGGNYTDALLAGRSYLLDEEIPTLTGEDMVRFEHSEFFRELEKQLRRQ